MSKQKTHILLYGDGLTKADLAKFGPGVGAREARYFEVVEHCDGVLVQTMHGSFIERITAAYTAAGIPILAGVEDLQNIKPLPAHLALVAANPGVLAGTEAHPALVDIGGKDLALTEIVRQAFEDSQAPSIEAWNSAEQSVRDGYINTVIERLRAEAGPFNFDRELIKTEALARGLSDEMAEAIAPIMADRAPTFAKPRRTYTRRAVKAPPEA